MKTLITGGTGLIGKQVIESFPESNTIYSVGRNKEKFISRSNIHWILHDFSESFNQSVFPDSIDTIIHLAQSKRFRDFPGAANDIFGVNTLSTLNLLEYARSAHAKTFVLASTGGIYGFGDQPFTEENKIIADASLGFYISSKLCSEIIAENYKPFMNIIILRFFFVYGPDQKKDMLIPRLIDSVIKEKPITLQGKDGIKINPIYVLDAARAVIQASILKESQKINVGGPDIVTLRNIGEIIGKEVGKEPIFEINENVDPRHIVGDIKKMSRILTKPKITIEQGIRKYLKIEK